MSLIGAVLLILAESKKETTNVFNAMPMMDDPNKTKRSYMVLSGRVLLVLMFLSLLRFSSGFTEILRNVVGCVLIAMITIGFKGPAGSQKIKRSSVVFDLGLIFRTSRQPLQRR